MNSDSGDFTYTPITESYVAVPRNMIVGLIERKNALLTQCLAALVCMSGEYKNDPLIADVKAELARHSSEVKA